LKIRWGTCQVCPYLVAAPQNFIYYIGRKLIRSKDHNDDRVCEICGCFARAKTHIPTESCPAPDPMKPEFSRWGEVLEKNR
jgi:hypothetical protein